MTDTSPTEADLDAAFKCWFLIGGFCILPQAATRQAPWQGNFEQNFS